MKELLKEVFESNPKLEVVYVNEDTKQIFVHTNKHLPEVTREEALAEDAEFEVVAPAQLEAPKKGKGKQAESEAPAQLELGE